MRDAPLIRVGNQTACSAEALLQPFEYALANGFDVFEWFPDKKPSGEGWEEDDLSAEQRRAIRAVAGARGMDLSVHARAQVNPLRADARPVLLQDLALAKDLGASLLNVHLYTEEGLEPYVESILPLVARLVKAGIQLSIENTPLTVPDDFNELFARLHGLPSFRRDCVGMCLDLGHANLCPSTRNDYLRYVDQLGPHVPIIHVHLHENWGDYDSHLPLFTGPARSNTAGVQGLIARLKRRHYSGAVILEQWPRPPSLLNEARERLLSLWGEQAGEATGSETATPAAASDFGSALVAADKRCRSWREKLDSVRSLISDGGGELTTKQLVDLAIYLRFLGTGEIACAEDGRHFRPAHHARLSRHIRQGLANLTATENAFVVRRIYPWLPSSDVAFTRPEPLTRIRDIAHRSDIPPELKREIKHTLQNKLHRCAGPEDLATSTALLERITAPGANYSASFVEQFKVFHEELKEFFNARSLDERLRSLLATAAAKDAALITRFLQEKTGADILTQLAAFRTLTELRRSLLAQMNQDPDTESQELRLTDIALEDFAFVLLSEMINHFDADARGAQWEPLLEALLLTIANLVLSTVDPDECRAIEAELQAWQRDFDPMDREQLLRLKATTERSRRLAEAYSDRIMALFSERVEQLGRALGVAEHAIRVFCDAEIRGHVIFQLSKLASSLLRRIRKDLDLPSWDVLVTGQAAGRLKAVESLDDLGQDLREPTVALLKQAEGDEEMPKGVVGIVLAHAISHLSHLGVRARQRGVVLVTCEETTAFAELRSLQGETVTLMATPESVKWEIADAPAASVQRHGDRAPVQVPKVSLKPDRPWVPLEQVVPEQGGPKATGARRLAELARLPAAEFRTPPALVVPFGVMEEAVRAAHALAAEYRQLLEQVDTMASGDLESTAERLRHLIQQCSVPGETVSAVARMFGPNDRLIVRSSANCEDLEELAGAGLYESVANVAPLDVAPAVRTVWSSLWTRRAALSRKQAGISHQQAHMAVLIQQMLTPGFAFILHTVNPINHAPREVYAEIAVGLGETLASAAIQGSPYRLICDKQTGESTVLAFANLSQAIWPDPAGGVTRKTVDYSLIDLSRDAAPRKQLGRRLASIARLVEQTFGQPQDIEGVVVRNGLYLVQSRRQEGTPSPASKSATSGRTGGGAG